MKKDWYTSLRNHYQLQINCYYFNKSDLLAYGTWKLLLQIQNSEMPVTLQNTCSVYVPQMNTVPQMNKIENSTLEMSTTNLSLGIDNMTKMVQKQ